ncbi:MAG: class I SAM-dependent rRNA methyltransferase [Chromatiales bacterium]
MDYAPLILKKHEERRLRAGHVWVFSNEVDTARTPLTAFAPGQAVSVLTHNGKALGTGYVNPRSLICARLVSRDPAQPFAPGLIEARIRAALQVRTRLFEEPYYRLIYGESDGLPGLIVDRYGSILVVQINTAGMESIKNAILAMLNAAISPRAILLRNDSPARALEGLPAYIETASGEVPETVMIAEHGCRFEVPLLGGQKTGWFFDHRLNRERMRHYVADRRVLDVFSYLGAWGIEAAVAGATEVTCVESSPTAAKRLQKNSELNAVSNRLSVRQADAFDALKNLRHAGASFDVIILDPPAFIKRKKDFDNGSEAYRRLNTMAMQLLAGDGVLISASCSSHLPAPDFRDLLRQAALGAHRRARVLEQGHQGPDHPVHLSIPETEYLKLFILHASEE